MKRYRLLGFKIDTSRNILAMSAPLAAQIRNQELESFKKRFGEEDLEAALKRYCDLKEMPSLGITHNDYWEALQDVVATYVFGSSYCALVGAVCLGERIFNEVIIKIRDNYTTTVIYNKVKGDTVQSWENGIEALFQWGVIKEETRNAYQELRKLRNDSVHYRMRDLAWLQKTQNAVKLINRISNDIFGIWGRKDILLVCDVPGEFYIRKDKESDPFVATFYLPCSNLVGYKHATHYDNIRGGFYHKDENTYPDQIVSDTEFVRLRSEHQATNGT